MDESAAPRETGDHESGDRHPARFARPVLIAAAVVLFLQRKYAPATDSDDEEDLGFDDLAGR
jgi:hypothetical protein